MLIKRENVRELGYRPGRGSHTEGEVDYEEVEKVKIQML